MKRKGINSLRMTVNCYTLKPILRLANAITKHKPSTQGWIATVANPIKVLTMMVYMI